MDSIPSKRRKYDIKIVSSPKPIHFSGKSSPQNWSLPKSIIDYITDYPSNSEVYQNMIKCCKYFFAKNPILVFSNLYYNLGEWTTERAGKNLELNNISCKFWITKVFEVFTYMSDINDKTASTVISRIYQCNVTDLLLNNQMISADELKIISSKVEYLHFYGVNVMDHDGSVFALEKLFKLFPKIKNFKFEQVNFPQ
uniref:Uncharacterized protein n=1 Tax=Panagrolaimus sp. PS1159 TaxID=55785 RepID=A0AC35F4X0_9BILA